MEYTINENSNMAGVTTRTLRYYNEIGLLTPCRVSSNGYRIYGNEAMRKLQQIPFYREFDLTLEKSQVFWVHQDITGKRHLKDTEMFKWLKEQNLKINEENYGEEIVENSNRKNSEQSQDTHEKAEKLATGILLKLYKAMDSKDPSSIQAQEVATLHKEWISIYWTSYSKEAHRGLAQMYVEDERFKAYYENEKADTAMLLRDIIDIFTK